MARIDRRFFDCSVYLYESSTGAEKGANWGGSGFLLAVPFEQDIDGVRRSHVYVVTNSHVVREYKSTVVRLNTHDGRSEVIPATYEQWIDDWNEDDLAMLMLDDTIMHRYRWLAPLPTTIIGDDLVNGIFDVGTEVIAISRFINFDGKQQNTPLALFGRIAGLNGDFVSSEFRKNFKQESILIDCKVIPGTSGSPVFAAPLMSASSSFVNYLIGVIWGYSHRKVQLRRKKDNNEIKESFYINENTGLMLVIPGWKLKKFLNRGDLVNERKRIEQKALEESESNR